MSDKNPHPIHIVLRDWTKVRKANNPVVAEKRKRGIKNEN